MSEAPAPRRVMFIGAHPDDETIMAGGTLAMLGARGIPTVVACATDGRGGESGGVANARTPEQLAVVRSRELACAVAALGVRTLICFGYEDPVMGPDEALFGFAADEEVLVEQIVAAVRDASPVDVLLTHGSDGEYGHPAHVQVHRAVKRAVQARLPEMLLYSMSALMPAIEDRLWNASDRAHLALDITPWAEAKVAAMRCHRTQHALFMRRRQLKDVAAALRAVESCHRHWPPVAPGELPDDAFAQYLRAAGAWQPEPPQS